MNEVDDNDEFIGKIVMNGRVTIPKKIRDVRDLTDGDYVKMIFVRKVISMVKGKE